METSHLSQRQHTLIAIALFFLTFLIYFRSQNTFISDSTWAVHIASSIINSGNINLDEYEQLVVDQGYFGVIRNKNTGHLLPQFPVGNSILIIPVMWVIEHTKDLPGQESFYQYLQQTSPYDPYLIAIQHFTASVITALVVLVLYYIGHNQFNTTTAILGVCAFAFGTSAYSTASRVLWQHGPSMLMLVITLSLFIKGQSDPHAVKWAGLPLAFSYIIRPTNSIPILIFTIVVLLRYRKQLPGYILSAMVVAVPFIGSNWLVYGRFLPPYYSPQRLGSSPYFWEALAGNLISPSRGLFVFSPVMLLALYGIYTKFRRADFRLIDGALAAVIGLHWIMISTFRHWWAGHSYGPRFFTDMMPYMTYFLLAGLYELTSPAKQVRWRQIGMGIFAVLASLSIAIHYAGANQTAVSGWSRWPVEVDTHPSVRLWDWTDLVFFRTEDDWPLADLPPSISFDLQTYDTNELFHVPMYNRTGNDHFWEIKLPSSLQIVKISGIDYSYAESGVPTVVGETALPTHAYQWLPIAIERPLDTFTDPSLGAIMVTTKTMPGEEKSVQVIPVSIVNNGRDWNQSDALNSQVWLPADIRINGSKADPTLYGLYGPGWYALESLEPYQWRWAQSPAELYIFSAAPRSLTLELTFSSLHDDAGANGLGDTGQLHVLLGEQTWVGQVNAGELNQIPLSLDKGWNTLVFNLESGNFSPADVDTASPDKRALSFSLDTINMVTTK